MCHYSVRAAESKYGKSTSSSAFGYSVATGGYSVQAMGGDNVLALSANEEEDMQSEKSGSSCMH